MPSPRECFLAFRRNLSRMPALHRQTVRARGLVSPRSDSLTGAAVAARLRRDGSDWRPIVSALSTPALVFQGTQDALPNWVGEELAKRNSSGAAHTHSGLRSHVVWEGPETLSPAVESFLLARTQGPAPPQ